MSIHSTPSSALVRDQAWEPREDRGPMRLPGALLRALLLSLTLLARPARAQTGFESQHYERLDLRQVVRLQYGPLASLVAVGEHLYDWRARIWGIYLPLDLQLAVTAQYGHGWTLASVGVHRDDWRAVRFARLIDVVLPVMLIASDRFYDVSGVRTGLSRFQSVLTADQNWYRLRAGSTFRLLQPLVLPTSRGAKAWINLSNSTADPLHRYDLLNAGVESYRACLPIPGDALRAVVSPYVGHAPDVWLGAAAGYHMAVVPPRATSLICPPIGPFDERCADATYAVGHELGHAFGLRHSCDDYPLESQCSNSIMQAAKPWDAILLPDEITRLVLGRFL